MLDSSRFGVHFATAYASCLSTAAPDVRLHSSPTDIRDTVNYKEIMKQYGLGPNGGIVTSLNLFATRFDQVMGFIEKRAPECKLAADT